jgi:uncharacterized protein with HEPN domain
MQSDKDQAYVSHILDAIGKIEKYLKGADFKEFGENDMLFDAVIRELAVIGEAANRLSGDFREKHPDVPFAKIVGMRNFLIHEYLGVEAKTVWDTCKEKLPELKRQLLS